MKIIIQAGGKGSRLEGLTRNKPKCLVPVKNLPILFHTFQKFPGAEFFVIADYKADVLAEYLKVFGSKYNFKIIKSAKKGTASGIKEALKSFDESEQVIISWCDLILSGKFKVPDNGNHVGVSKDFECRWSFKNKEFIKKSLREQGVAGLFVFENKSLLKTIPKEGALVDWLQAQNIDFKELSLKGSKEIGTMLSYNDINDDLPCCRPFNSLEFDENIVIKRGINEQGKKIAVDEIAWYKHVKEQGYELIPEIVEYEPLKMRRVQGKNIFEYDYLVKTQKKEILKRVIDALKELHNLEPRQAVNIDDVRETFLTKTFERLSKIQNLVPFADKEVIKINGVYCKNVFFSKKELTEAIEKLFPKEFVLIHGDCTFSNLIFDTFNMKIVLIDPRGYFGKTKFYGDADYDWAKLYYSIKGNYDQFNRKRFTLNIKEKEIELAIKSNGWMDMEQFFFDNLPYVSKRKIKLLHAIIWFSLTTYAWADYDSICGAFYNGLLEQREEL
jgi:thiamine kinase-like enzyme